MALGGGEEGRERIYSLDRVGMVEDRSRDINNCVETVISITTAPCMLLQHRIERQMSAKVGCRSRAVQYRTVPPSVNAHGIGELGLGGMEWVSSVCVRVVRCNGGDAVE